MARVALSPLEAKIRQARRRLVLQSFIHRGIAFVCVAMAIGLGWFLLQPLVIVDASPTLRWALLFGLVGGSLGIATILTYRRRPSKLDAALELDQKFQLRERLTTALNLDEHTRHTEIGQALIDDANIKAGTLTVGKHFPVGLSKRAWWIPAQAMALLLIVWLYNPNLSSSTADAGEADPELVQGKKPEEFAKKANPDKPPIRKPPQRKNKSEALKDLEKELDKFYGETKTKDEENKAEQARAKAEQIASAEEKLKKFVSEQTEKFNNLQEQLSKLNTSEAGENKPEGFDKDFRDALSKGDLNKAKEEIEGLKKKAKEKGLSEEEQKKLDDQLKSLADKLEQVAKNEKEQKKLEKLIEQAKKEGRDAEALERELKRLQDEASKHKELENLAKTLGQCKKCLEQKDFDGLSDQLGELSKQLDDLQDQLEDLTDAEEHLQNLKQLRDGLCKECDGECDGEYNREGNGKEKGKAVASGNRAENPDAQSNSEEARQRGLFDARGRKTYGGSVDGPAFKKKTSVEMSGEIQEAVQEAAEAMEVQRLRKSDQQAVKEYFERLGKQVPTPARK